MAADMEEKEHAAETVAAGEIKVAKPLNKTTRGFNQKFLDLFWRLAENDAESRLNASIEIIKQLDAVQSTTAALHAHDHARQPHPGRLRCRHGQPLF